MTTDLLMVLERFDPRQRPRHCSNCANCRVRGEPEEPMAYCTAGGSGRYAELSLAAVVRARNPASFGPCQAGCLDFVTAGEDEE